MDFLDPALLQTLGAADSAALDAAPFGIIAFDRAAKVVEYNALESRSAGLSRELVIGKTLFEDVAPCMNNFLVAQRFVDEPELDATLDYVLTLRMRPTRVRIRLLQHPESARAYVLVERP